MLSWTFRIQTETSEPISEDQLSVIDVMARKVRTKTEKNHFCHNLCEGKKSPNVYKGCPKMISQENDRF